MNRNDVNVVPGKLYRIHLQRGLALIFETPHVGYGKIVGYYVSGTWTVILEQGGWLNNTQLYFRIACRDGLGWVVINTRDDTVVSHTDITDPLP